MRPWIWLMGLGALGLLSCNAPVVNDIQSPPQREIRYTSVSEVSAPAAPAAAVPLESGRPDGVLTEDASCRRLVSDDPLFDNDDARKAFDAYRAGSFSSSAFEKLAMASGRSSEERQRLLFLAALSASKENHADRAVALMKQAYAIDAPLQRVSAVYGTKYGYRAKLWADIVDFTEQLADSESYRTYRGIALANLGRYDAAALEFENISKYPAAIRLDALEARARAQSETSQLRASLETYRRIYELDPGSAQGQLAQEAIMAQKDRWPKGFEFPRAAQKTDKSKSAREIAQAHFDAHRSEKAIAAYTKLLREDKNRKDTARVCEDLYGIARSHVKLRAHSKSLPFFEEALETCGKTDLQIKILYSAAKAAWNAGQNDKALRWYDDITTGYADHSYADDAYHYRAQILMAQGRTDEARQTLETQIEKYPDGDMAKDAYWMLLSDLYDRGQWRDAVAFVDRTQEHAGESDLYTQGRLRYFQGRAYEKLEEKPHAVQNYLRILDEYPLSYYAMLSLGRLEAIDSAQAKTWIETYRARAYRPEQGLEYCFKTISGTKSFSAARMLTTVGLYDDALEEIDAMVSSPDTRVAYEAKLARAIILQKSGRYTDSARLAASLLNPPRDLVYRAYAPWLLAYPKPWNDIVSKAATPESSLYYTAYAIMREESYYNPKAESWANARGLMQLMLPTAQSSAADAGLPKPSASDLFKPEIGIPIGIAYIAKLYKILVPHPMFVLPGYNAGQGNVGKWMARFADVDVDVYVEKIPFKEARHYAKRVGTTLWRYRWLYDAELPPLFNPGVRVGTLK